MKRINWSYIGPPLVIIAVWAIALIFTPAIGDWLHGDNSQPTHDLRAQCTDLDRYPVIRNGSGRPEAERAYTIEAFPESRIIDVYLNSLNDQGAVAKMKATGGIVGCEIFEVRYFVRLRYSPNYDRQEIVAELDAVLAAHFGEVDTAIRRRDE